MKPIYLRAERRGTLVRGYVSEDGLKWSVVAEVTTKFPANVSAGVCASVNQTTGARVELAELSLTPVAAPAAPLPAVAPFDAAKAKEHQDAWAKHLGVDVEITNSIGMKLRLIPPGTFLMGSTKAEVDELLTRSPVELKPTIKEIYLSETPRREMTIDKAFYMGIHEVTVGQFRQFVKETDFKTHAEATGKGGSVGGKDKKAGQFKEYIWSHPEFALSELHPVGFVNYEDAEAFCAWLSKKEKRRYVVPRDEHWEFACRAGTTTLWWCGNDPADAQKLEALGKTVLSPVGSRSPNPFGLFDMHGNASEWCADAGNKVYRRGIAVNTWLSRSAARQPSAASRTATNNYGFRVAIDGEFPPRDAGWRPLFNGKDLTGWQAFANNNLANPEKAWQVVDGVLRCTGQPQGYLYTTSSHENYELTFEWQAPKKPAGQNECLLHLHGQSPTENLPESIGVNLFENTKVIIYESNPKLFKEGRTIAPDPNAKSKDGWQQVRIRCEKDAIEIEINRRVRYRGASAPWQRGFIAFRSALQPLEIRNLRIRSLP